LLSLQELYVVIYNGVEQTKRISARVSLLIHKNFRNRIHSYTLIRDENYENAYLLIENTLVTVIRAQFSEHRKSGRTINVIKDCIQL